MAKKGNLISVREDVRVLDCTMRDGGLVNNFNFTDDFVKALYQANIAAGVDYMEFGYKADRDIFPEEDFGKWKFCKDEDIRAIVGDNDTNMKIAVMADVGRCNFKRDIIDKKDSPIDLIRIATYTNTIPAAIELVDYCHAKGYETCVNIMAISKDTEADLRYALDMLGESDVDGIYLVDSYGSLYPEQIRYYTEMYVEYGEKYNKFIGVHAHNNQQLAFANSIDSIAYGTSYVDVTVNSIGRGAGNCPSELMLGFLKNPKYRLPPILRFIEKHMLPLREQGEVWGYDLPYLLTGRENQHPRSAIDFIRAKRTDYTNFYHNLMDRE